MSDSKISALTAAAAVADANEFAINEAGTSKKVTGSQIKTYAQTSVDAITLNGKTFAAPAAIGSGTPAAGSFTTVGATGQITSTLANGTAPLVVASSTNVANLNASSLSGATMASPGAIGGSSAAAGTFTVLTANTSAALTSPTFAAGSATAGSWPIHTPGSTLLTSAVAGAVEVDGNCFYATTEASNRGVVPVTQYIRQHADRAAFANDTNQHPIFDSVTNGTITIGTGNYTYEALIQCKVMSATSGNVKWSLKGGGGATLASVLQMIMGVDGALDSQAAISASVLVVETASTGTNIVAASTGTIVTLRAFGSFECTGAGTIIPSIAQTTAVTTAVVTAGSYFRLTRIGAAATVSVGNWS